MKKTMTIILLSFTLIFCVAFGALANTVSPASNSSQMVNSQHVAQTPQTVSPAQSPVKSYDRQKVNPSNGMDTPHPSRLARFKQFMHNRIVRPVKSGWQHLKNLKIRKHNHKNVPEK